MNTVETKDPKATTHLNIPAGALVIIPMRNRMLFPSMVMPLMVNRPARRQAVEEAVRQQLPHWIRRATRSKHGNARA